MVHDQSVERNPLIPIHPRYYGPDNTQQATGHSYRFIRADYERLGGKCFQLGKGQRRFAIDAEDYHRRLREEQERLALQDPTEPEVDGATAILASLGLKVRQ